MLHFYVFLGRVHSILPYHLGGPLVPQYSYKLVFLSAFLASFQGTGLHFWFSRLFASPQVHHLKVNLFLL